jgi:hypothetical protein
MLRSLLCGNETKSALEYCLAHDGPIPQTIQRIMEMRERCDGEVYEVVLRRLLKAENRTMRELLCL